MLTDGTQDEDLIQFEDNENLDSESIEIPREMRKINTQAYDKSVADVIRMINDNEIILNPEYQRNYVWDTKRASLLIESIILNVPIPVIYVSQEEDDTWTVIDGLQRLNSLKRFFDRDFKLTGLEVLTELNKSDIKSLNEKALRVLKNGLLRIIVISHDSHPEIKYDVFMRLNRGSVKLTEQELRNCLYRGKLNDLLKELTNNKNLLTLLNLSGPHKRMVDCELILRFLAIKNGWNQTEGVLIGYKGKMKSFLNEFMLQNSKIDDIGLELISNDVAGVCEKVLKIYGVNAFHRIAADGTYESGINRAIMDILMVSSSYFTIEELISKKDKIIEKLKDMILNDGNFRDSLTVATSDKKVIAYRLKVWIDELNRIIHE